MYTSPAQLEIGSEESCIRLLPAAKHIADMPMEDYANWIARGVPPPGLQEVLDKEMGITPEQRKELDAAEAERAT